MVPNTDKIPDSAPELGNIVDTPFMELMVTQNVESIRLVYQFKELIHGGRLRADMSPKQLGSCWVIVGAIGVIHSVCGVLIIIICESN